MQTVTQEYFFETEVKKSKFLTFLMPYNTYAKRLEELKQLHPKARHHVVCYRRMNTFEQIEEYATDDNEPKGCAGKPTLNVLRGADLINCATITVRYFGGIKLGTGGMVRAYSLAAKNVIAEATLIGFEMKHCLTISFLYAYSKQVEYFLEQHHIEVEDKAYLENRIEFILQLTKAEQELVEAYAQKEMLISILY